MKMDLWKEKEKKRIQGKETENELGCLGNDSKEYSITTKQNKTKQK